MTIDKHAPYRPISRTLAAAAVVAAFCAPAQADDSTMLLQYELAHGIGRTEHSLNLAWAPPREDTAMPVLPATAGGMRVPLFSTAADRWTLFKAAPDDDETGSAGDFGRAVGAIVLIGITVAAIAYDVDKRCCDFKYDVPVPQPAPPPNGG